MIEWLRTTQIAFFTFATLCGFSRGSADEVQKYPCKGSCKRKSYETICENTVSRYQNLVSSLPREAVFRRRQPKAHFMTGRTGSPVKRKKSTPTSKVYSKYTLQIILRVYCNSCSTLGVYWKYTYHQ